MSTHVKCLYVATVHYGLLYVDVARLHMASAFLNMEGVAGLSSATSICEPACSDAFTSCSRLENAYISQAGAAAAEAPSGWG